MSLSVKSNKTAIAGGVVGGLILVLLLVLAGVFLCLRRRRMHTASSPKFLTVRPPEAPFARMASYQSGPPRIPTSFPSEKDNTYAQNW